MPKMRCLFSLVSLACGQEEQNFLSLDLAPKKLENFTTFPPQLLCIFSASIILTLAQQCFIVLQRGYFTFYPGVNP